MNAFIAWTPLHIINIINTVEAFYPQDLNDIYVYDEFAGAEEVYSKLIEENSFNNVYLIPHKETGNFLKKGMAMLLNLQNFVEHNAVYDNMFIQGGNYFSKILYGETKRKNANVRLHYIEDGLGAYIGSPIIRIDTVLKKAVKMLNKYSMYHAKIKSYFVYEPNLIENKLDASYLKLPKITQDNPAFYRIKRIFSMNNSSESEKMADQILFFDQPFLADGFAINEIEVLNQIQRIGTKKPLVVKFHPRSSRNKYGSIHSVETELPWELYCLNLELENVLLLSVATTGSFTPYLMFGIKTPVIMLASYYLEKVKQESGQERTIKMLENVLEFSVLYQEKTNAIIYMPQSEEELARLLN